jgi:pumilio family protein 6
LSKNKKPTGKGDKKNAGKASKKPFGKPVSGATKSATTEKKAYDGNAKKVVKSSNSDSVGKKPEHKRKPDSNGTGKEEGKKKFKPKAKKPMTPEERKMAKPHYKLVEGLKTNWNKARDRSTETDVRSTTVAKMVEQFKDHILAVTLRHDASRIVQTVLQFGTVEQKEVILHSLCQKASEIAKTPYGHFTILKAITYCTRPADQRKLAAALKGHFVSLGGNVIGSRTVESVLQIYPHAITRNLKAEFYGQVRTLVLRFACDIVC